MNELFDAETGEELSTSEAAQQLRVKAGTPPPVHPDMLSALAAAVAEMPVWIREAEVADLEFKTGRKASYKYATLKTILQTVRPILLNHGVRIRQGASPSWLLDGGSVKGRLVPIYTDLVHTQSGSVDRTTIEIPVTRLDPQAMGSAVSYGRRYTLLAALGLATDEAEDDGQAAKGRDITEYHPESNELLGLRDEMNALEDVAKLKAWGEKLKATKRADNLDDGEAALLRRYYTESLQRLTAAAQEKTKK